MGIRDSEQAQAFGHFLEPLDDLELLAEASLRRQKQGSGRPVRNSQELDSMLIGPEEHGLVRSVYNKFSPRLNSDTKDEEPPASSPQ